MGTVCSDQPKRSPKALETFFLPSLIRHKDPKSLESAWAGLCTPCPSAWAGSKGKTSPRPPRPAVPELWICAQLCPCWVTMMRGEEGHGDANGAIAAALCASASPEGPCVWVCSGARCVCSKKFQSRRGMIGQDQQSSGLAWWP